MPTYEYLSPAWIEEALRIRESFRDRARPAPPVIRINQVVTDAPLGDGTVRAYFDTSNGSVEMGLGTLEAADVTLTLDYATARTIFLAQRPQATTLALAAGKIKVEGDVLKMLLAQVHSQPVEEEIAAAVKAITA